MQALFNKTRGDKVIWVAVILLALLSLLVIYSSTGTLAHRLSKSAESTCSSSSHLQLSAL